MRENSWPAEEKGILEHCVQTGKQMEVSVSISGERAFECLPSNHGPLSTAVD